MVMIEPAETRYGHVREEDREGHCRGAGRRAGGAPRSTAGQLLRGAELRGSGKRRHIDPEKIDEYIARGGYEALLKVLTEMSPGSVIEQISKSGLRGRGGGGYPTGLKWDTVAKVKGAQKYVICNGDEGDPGAFMDRSVLESDPQRVIEGMRSRHTPLARTRAMST